MVLVIFGLHRFICYFINLFSVITCTIISYNTPKFFISQSRAYLHSFTFTHIFTAHSCKQSRKIHTVSLSLTQSHLRRRDEFPFMYMLISETRRLFSQLKLQNSHSPARISLNCFQGFCYFTKKYAAGMCN